MSNRPRDLETLTPSISPDKKPSGGISMYTTAFTYILIESFSNKLFSEQTRQRASLQPHEHGQAEPSMAVHLATCQVQADGFRHTGKFITEYRTLL